MNDIVRELGFMCLGSRMRRIGERMQADVQQVIDDLELPLQTSSYPILAALDRYGPQRIGDLADAVGVAQPGMTKSVNRLLEDGLVEVLPSGRDQRRRTIDLSDAGRSLVERSRKDVWPAIEKSVRDLCGEDGLQLLHQLETLEARASERPLHDRLRGRLRESAR